MMNKTNILTVSIIAMMAVGSVRADIASTNYVNAQIQPVSQALAGKQDKSNMVTATTGNAYQNIKENIAVENDITTQYPSVATVGALLKDFADDLGGDMGSKQDTLVSSGNGANVVYSGNGDVVTNVSATGGTVTITKGTTLGSLATKDEVAKSDLASDVQTSLDAADNALPAATYNTQIGTVSAANMGSTASTVVGAISEINDTTNTASLKSRIGKAEGDISQLGTQISTLSSDSQVKSTADYQVGKQGGGWTTLDTNQVAAINSGATSALVGKISTNEAAINKLNGTGDGSVANSIANALTSYSTTAQMNAALDNKANTADLATVATTGSYNDLENKPTIPSIEGLATTSAMNTALAGKQPVSSGVSVGGADGSWNSLTNGSGITITTSNGTTTIATAKAYIPVPSAAGTTGKSVLTYDSEANAGAGAYYWEEIGR